jgi:hypothetical protein
MTYQGPPPQWQPPQQAPTPTYQQTPRYSYQPIPQPPVAPPPNQPRPAGSYEKKSTTWRNVVVGSSILIALLIGIAIGGLGKGSSNNNAAATTTATVTSVVTVTARATGAASNPAAKTTGATAAAPNVDGRPLPIQSGDWRLDSISVKNDGLGDFGGSGRIAYTGKDTSGGTNLFTVTVFINGKQVATLDGSADSVPTGNEATVELISNDPYVVGTYTYDFQKNV